MISYDEFLRIFMESKNIIVSEEELEKFYNSIIPSLIFFYAGKSKEEKLMQLEEECQWPMLKKIGNQKLDIYKGADPVLLNMFHRCQCRCRRSDWNDIPL